MAEIGVRKIEGEFVEVSHDVVLCQMALGLAQIVTVFQALIVALREGNHITGEILDRCIEKPWLASHGDIVIAIPRDAVAMGELFMEAFKASFEDLLGYSDALIKMFDHKGHPYDKDVVGVLNAAVKYLIMVKEGEADGCEGKLEEVGH